HGFLAGRLPAGAAREVFGDRRAVVAGQLEPGGIAEAVKGGYRVSGRWPFASGCQHATWLLAHCVVPGGRRRAGGRPTTRLVFVPADRARIHDTWRVSGLRGTGSHDYSLEGVMVPAAYSLDAFADEPTRPERLYAYPVNAGGSAAAAVDVVWGLAGSRAIFEDAGLERRFRDVHAATQHVALAPRTLEMAGRVLLGLEPLGLF